MSASLIPYRIYGVCNLKCADPLPHLFTVINEANFVSIKLSESNYTLWKAQIDCLLESQDLVGFVDGTITSPLESVTIAPGTTVDGSSGARETVNQDYLQWRKTDRLVKGLLLGSLNELVLRDVVDKATVGDVWLEWKRFAILNLKVRLIFVFLTLLYIYNSGVFKIYEYMNNRQDL